MLKALKTEANRTVTENGAATHITTMSDCLDLFATVGALRSQSEYAIAQRFRRAYAEDPDLAMKILFFARDVRGGLGERKVFRVGLNALAERYSESVRRNIARIPEFGRWDDVLALLDTPCEADALALIAKQLEQDQNSQDMGGDVSLLAKWLPSVNASSAKTVRAAKHIAKSLGLTDVQYRKTLVQLRRRIRILENNLRERDYTFSYEKQPSRALFKYRKAFLRSDADRYNAFLEAVRRGTAAMHTDGLMPYDIIAPFFCADLPIVPAHPGPEEAAAIDAAWNAQPDYTNGENALVVIDGSGSMYSIARPSPAMVALSLGIYFAERNTGAFHNHFITFSTRPQLVQIKGADIARKLDYCRSFNECSNTNIQRVFELILKAAVKHKVPQSEMPATVYIISDMEFDWCTEDASVTNFEYAKRLFEKKGYRLPRVVFWNVRSRGRQQPVTRNEQGVALVSGTSPRIFGMLSSGNLTPMGYMLDILGAARYADITA